jgi:hypothetical protein
MEAVNSPIGYYSYDFNVGEAFLAVNDIRGAKIVFSGQIEATPSGCKQIHKFK